MREMKRKTIDGHVYEFSQLNTTRALRYAMRVSKMLLEPIALGMSALDSADSKQQAGGLFEREIDASKLGDAARVLVSRMDEDGVLDIIKTLCGEEALCDGKKIVFDVHYEDKLGHLLSVLAAAVEVQFGSFFGDGGVNAAISAIRNRVTTPASATSIGQSGDPSPKASSAA